MQRLVNSPEVALGHGVGQHLGGAGGAFKNEQLVVRAGARTPEAEPLRANQRGDAGGVQQARVGVGALQVPVHILGDAQHAIQRHIRQALVPALLAVDAGAQAHGKAHGRNALHHAGAGLRNLPAWPQQHQLAGVEVLAVVDGLGCVGAVRLGVHKGAQLLRHRHQGGGDSLAIEARGAQDFGLDAQLCLGRQQRLHAGVVAAHGGADGLPVLIGLLGCSVCALTIGHAHHHQHGAGLFLDGGQGTRQRAQVAGLRHGGVDLCYQHGGVEWERGGVRVAGRGNQADDRCGNDAQRALAFVDFQHSDAVVVVGSCGHGVLQLKGLGMDLPMVPRPHFQSHRCALCVPKAHEKAHRARSRAGCVLVGC